MQYIKVSFTVTDQDGSDVLIALLADAGYNGFEETGTELLAYIEEPLFHEGELSRIAALLDTGYRTDVVAPQNWNALWESNFQPVIVECICTIRAHFHDIAVTTPFEIVITPKMSFGTGHHATTQLMIRQMNDLDFQSKTVLDFGTGTGVLAILAGMLGAKSILAIDNDEWSVENGLENVARNQAENITVRQASLEDIDAGSFDIILANINRHILLEHMPGLYTRLSPGGTLLMSGLLTTDQDIITEAAMQAGFVFHRVMEQNNWISLLFSRPA